jgi:hypothetical protein
MPDHLKPEEIARRYAFTPQTVRGWIREGARLHGRVVKLRAVRLGRCYRVPTEAWEEFFAALNSGPPQPSASAEHATREREQRATSRRVRKLVGLPLED